MPNSNVPRFTQKHSHLTRKQNLNNQESDVEIREAINAGSASSFVTSRLQYFVTYRGLNTSGGAQ